MKYIRFSVLFFVTLFFIGHSHADDSLCPVAKDISKKAYGLLKTDIKESLKLFIKAQKICPEPEYDYNLSIAYWKYGAPEKAVSSMYRALEKKSYSQWENSLAFMLIKTGKDPKKALFYAKKAFKANENNPAFADTLVKANLFAGNYFEALKLADESGRKWSSNEKILASKNFVFQKYLTTYLECLKNNEYEKGVNGLKKASDIIPGAAKAFCFALFAGGKNEAALLAAKNAEKKFNGSHEVKGLFDEVIKKVARGFYDEFQSGNDKKALALSKKFSDKYPHSKIAKETYERIFNAFLNSEDVSVPASVAIAENENIKTDSDALMSSLFADNKKDEKIDLIPDIEKNIPVTKVRNANAVAVVIGNKRYKKFNKGINDVVYAERDAAIIKKYLIKTLGFEEENIIYYLNTTSSDLRDIFGTRANRRGKLSRFVRKNESDVFIYYSGHGAPGADGRSSFLVPVDASADFVANNGYPLDLFYEQIENLGAKSIMVVLESCFSGDSASGALFKNISPALVQNISPVKKIENALVLCSADKDQVATWYPEKRHGLFTYFFLKGLSGKADKNRDKKISLKEISKYLDYEVPHWAGRKSNRTQTPVYRGDMDKVIAVLD